MARARSVLRLLRAQTFPLAADPFVQIGLLAVSGALLVRILLRKYPAHRLFFQSVFFVALTTPRTPYSPPPPPTKTSPGKSIQDRGELRVARFAFARSR